MHPMVSLTKGFIVRNPLTVIGGIVTLIGLAVTMVIALGQNMPPAQQLILITTIVGLVANAIPSLLALLKSEATQHDIRNGVVKDKVKQALTESVAEGTVEVAPGINTPDATTPPTQEGGATNG